LTGIVSTGGYLGRSDSDRSLVMSLQAVSVAMVSSEFVAFLLGLVAYYDGRKKSRL
jgi:hypothetical protein